MLIYRGMTKAEADIYKAGGRDAYGTPPEPAVSNGSGNPCRCCLQNIPKDRRMLVLAHRPFAALHPYAETGPVFLCADNCAPDGDALPEVLTTSPTYLLKGYDTDERIVYGTGQITDAKNIAAYAQSLLDRPDIAFVDVRSARNNCWQVRITSA